MITIVAAMARNRVIGYNNKLPWGRIPVDMRHFRRTTLQHPVIMGRSTFMSIGKPLQDRTNIVLTRDRKLQFRDCLMANSLEDAVYKAECCHSRVRACVIGGASVFLDALPLAVHMYITEIDADFEGDAYFPEFDLDEWSPLTVQSFSPSSETAWHPIRIRHFMRNRHV